METGDPPFSPLGGGELKKKTPHFFPAPHLGSQPAMRG
jgi:hypothetical protein